MKKKKKILIVDDNLAIRTLLRELLVSGGYEVVGEAKDSAEGLVMCKSLHPDLVTLDVLMENKGKMISDINKTIAAVKAILKYNSKIKVVIISGLPYKDILEGFLTVGVSGCLSKPFTDEELYCVIDKALN